MNPLLLELHFAELSKAWNRSVHNNYSDNNKKKYQEKLSKLFECLRSEDFSTLSTNKIIERTFIINFFILSIDFLDNSTFNLIPFEAVECLNVALNEWLDNSQEFIIVTSMDKYGHSFDPKLVSDKNLYTAIQNVYGIDFPIKLIQINIPKHMIHDYLVSVVLYHELGHFIDRYYHITRILQAEILGDYYRGKLSSEEKTEIEHYFPYISEKYYSDVYQARDEIPMFEAHLAEYFADIFAAQYIEKTLNNYLVYVSGDDSMHFHPSHPSTDCRCELINSFFSTPSYLINKFSNSAASIGKELKIRFEIIEIKDFINLIPPRIENASQLHYLLIAAWDLWLNHTDEFQKVNKMQFDLDKEKIYEIINNLVEKSIGNYFIEHSWKKYIPNVS